MKSCAFWIKWECDRGVKTEFFQASPLKTLCWRFSLLCEKSTKSCSSRDAPSGPEKVNKNVAQNAKQRNLYYPNLERREADASELQASQHSTRDASHRGHRCCRPTRPRPPAPFDETSARLTTTTTEVSYRAQPGSPRRFPARPVLSLFFSVFLSVPRTSGFSVSLT